MSVIVPNINVYENESGLKLLAEIPGVSKEGLKVNVENEKLVVFGETETLIPEQKVEFKREFKLSPRIDTEKIAAKLENGLLEINLPIAESAKPRTINIA